MYKTFSNVKIEEVKESINPTNFISLDEVLKKKNYIDDEQYKKLEDLRKDLLKSMINNKRKEMRYRK